MNKLGALIMLVAVAAVINFLNPGSQVRIPSSLPIEAGIEQPNPSANKQTASRTMKDSQDSLKNTDAAPHSHEVSTAVEQVEIPQYIKDSLEAKRIPASELVEEKYADGSSSIDFKGQYQHVPVAVIGEDGKVKIVETRIEPIAAH